MKSFFSYIFILLFAFSTSAQREFHVFPKDHKLSPGSETGDGSLKTPWDLQTALNQMTDIVNGGDTIWLHKGVYNGRFSSTLKSTVNNKFITVSGYKKDRVILNGNVTSKEEQTLKVNGDRVIFKNFDITWLGDFNRDARQDNFKSVAGINHLSGVDCKFINLKIYNNPGLGFGSWKSTGGTLITECIVYNNGAIRKDGKGGGEGFYVQNKSDDERIIKNNIIFNNYYKGIEVWSAGRNANFEYVKNITLDNNVVFNSGLPSGFTVDNIIVASDDRNGINIAKNITVKNNILYHNTDYSKNQVNGNAPSLTLGFYKKAPVENIIVDNNIILGRNNALRILHAKSLAFTNNKVYSGYVTFTNSIDKHALPAQWKFNNNKYYTKNTNAFRIHKTNISFKAWKSKFPLDQNSEVKHTSAFDLNAVINITESDYTPNNFRVVLFNKNTQDVTIDFSNYTIKKGSSYTVRDVENYDEILKSGIISDNLTVTVPMQLNDNLKPKTLNNFGVYIIEFKSKEEKRTNFFKRFFKWLF